MNAVGISGAGGAGTEIDNITLRDFKVTRNVADTNDKALIQMSYCDDLTITNVTCLDSDASGINITNCDGVIVSSCLVDGYDGTIAGTGRGIFFDTCTQVVCSGNNIKNGISGQGIHASGSANISISDNIITEITGAVNAIGLFISTSGNARISNISISNITTSGIANIAFGLYLATDDSQVSNVRIDNVDNTTTADNSYGIYVTSDRNAITGANVADCSGKGVRLTATADSTMFEDCVASDNGADSGIDNTNEDNFSDSGTNTFTE